LRFEVFKTTEILKKVTDLVKEMKIASEPAEILKKVTDLVKEMKIASEPADSPL
jgi:hypothetical protein